LLKKKLIGGVAVMALMAGSIAIPTLTSASQTTAVVALDGTFSGFNNFTSANNSFYLGQVLNQIWPSPYLFNDSAKLVIDTNIVTKASSTSNSNGQQVVTYTINPKAVWSDGVPLTADDFIYMFQASAGNTDANGNVVRPLWTDVDGQPYDVAGNSGYDQISSVVGSNPSPTVTTSVVKGKTVTKSTPTPCASGSTANRDAGLCPNGRTVTVTFLKGQPYPEWQGLFGLLPAHIARVVGWNSGMDDPSKAVQNIVSAGPYVLSSVDQSNNTYIETQNPKWWGTPAKINRLVFTNLADDTQGIAGLAAGDFQVFQPTTVSADMVSQASQQANVNQSIIPSYTFEHLDFNVTHSTWMAKTAVRQAIAYAVNRSDIIAATVGQVYPATQPDDNYIFMQKTQSGYKPDGKAYDIGGSSAGINKAMSLLGSVAGLYYGKDSMWHTGSATGPVLTFVLQEKGSSVRAAEAQIIQGNLKKVGINVSIVVRSNSTLPAGNFDMVIFGWVGSPFLSGNVNIYGCTVDSNNVCQPNSSNYGNYADVTASNYMNQANIQTALSGEIKYYALADQSLWTGMPSLPLYQSPEAAFWTDNVSGVANNPTQAGIDWNAQNWGIN